MGTDKASLLIDGLPLARRTAGLLAMVADPAVEIGPGSTGLPAMAEDPPGRGPLAAVAAGADYLETLGHRGPVIVLATDLPRLTVGLVELLASSPVAGCLVPMDRGRPQPLCARYDPAALVAARRLVAAGERSMTALLEQVDVTWLEPADWQAAAGDPDALLDVDTPQDLTTFRGAHGG
jgi:molybdopterin-guanine dinucleotide biosynthesis protein A